MRGGTAMVTNTDHRQAIIDGLRELAQFLADHPDVPVDADRFGYCVGGNDDAHGIAEVQAIAGVLGSEVTTNQARRPDGAATHYQTRRQFGPGAYEAFYVTRRQM